MNESLRYWDFLLSFHFSVAGGILRTDSTPLGFPDATLFGRWRMLGREGRMKDRMLVTFKLRSSKQNIKVQRLRRRGRKEQESKMPLTWSKRDVGACAQRFTYIATKEPCRHFKTEKQ